MGVPNECLIM